jgi:lipopolysaccharide export system permease protein
LKILDKYVLRFFISSYAMCMTICLTCFVIFDAFHKAPKILRRADSLLWGLIQYYSVQIPVIFYQMGPFLTLLAAMFTVTRLSRNNEIVPMKACGISAFRFLLPILLSGLLLTGVIVLDQEVILPKLSAKIRKYTLLKSRNYIEPGFVADRDGKILEVSKYYPESQTITGVRFTTRYASGMEKSVLKAARGRWVESPERTGWLLSKGTIWYYDKSGREILDTQKGKVVMDRFGEDGWLLKTDIQPIDIVSLERKATYLSFSDLNAQYKRQPYAKHLRVELHQRFSFPLANVILLLLGLPFVMRQESRSIFLGLLICLVICASFFFFNFLFTDLGNRGNLSPIIAAWLPTLFFGGLGLMLFDAIRT